MPANAKSGQERVEVSSESLTIVVKHAALAGLCPIIPLPFLDDHIIKRVKRRMFKSLSEAHALKLSKDAAKILTARQSGLVKGALKSILFYPIKRILKKVLVVFLVKACADVATSTVEEGWLFARALERGYVDVKAIAASDEEVIKQLRDAIIEATDEVDSSVARAAMHSVYGIFISSFGELKSVVSRLAQKDSNAFEEAASGASSLIEQIEAVVRNEWANFEELDEALRRELSKHGYLGRSD